MWFQIAVFLMEGNDMKKEATSQQQIGAEGFWFTSPKNSHRTTNMKGLDYLEDDVPFHTSSFEVPCSFWRKYQNSWEVEWKRLYHRCFTLVVKCVWPTSWASLISHETYLSYMVIHDMLIHINLTTKYITIGWRKMCEEKKKKNNNNNSNNNNNNTFFCFSSSFHHHIHLLRIYQKITSLQCTPAFVQSATSHLSIDGVQLPI